MVSDKKVVFSKMTTIKVLILVLMEDGLGHEEGRREDCSGVLVLILVLMEDGLGPLPTGGSSARHQGS